MNNQLLQAAKHALEFIQSIDGYENGKTANELRQAIEAAEQERAADAPYWVCLNCGEVSYLNTEKCLRCKTVRR